MLIGLAGKQGTQQQIFCKKQITLERIFNLYPSISFILSVLL